MADGGGWQNGTDTALARERFQAVLAEFAERLNAPQPMRRDTAVALVEQMERLGRRMAAEHDAALGRVAELDSALAALSARLEQQATRDAQHARQVEQLLADLTEARAAKRPLMDARAVRAILAAVAACAALCGAGAGVLTLSRSLSPKPVPVPPASVTEDVSSADVALAETAGPVPPPITTTTAAPVAPPAAKVAVSPPRETYAAVAEAVTRGEATAMARLTGLAKAGDAKAQLRLAQVYETGALGLPRDLAAARFWTLRAAAGGETVAMYNAAQFLMEGDGGPQDLPNAAVWFRRAAERGVVDAQFNYGLMLDLGRGVKRDPREALKWYARAAKAGDTSAAQRQAELERDVSPERAVAAPAPAPGAKAEAASPATPPDTGVTGASVGETQAFLARKGYYIGPVDGVVSPALQAAAAAYMRDRPIATAR